MTTLGRGARVMLIGRDPDMPPLGTRGVVVSELDEWGDFDVLLHGYPCPVPPDSSWVAHWSWLLPLGDDGTAYDAAAVKMSPIGTKEKAAG